MATNFYGILTAETPALSLGDGFDAELIDAAGAQTINVFDGATVNLMAADGANIINLEGDALDYTVEGDGYGNMVFTHATTGATISITATATAQAMVFGDGSADLVIVGTEVDLGGQTVTSALADTVITADLNEEETSDDAFAPPVVEGAPVVTASQSFDLSETAVADTVVDTVEATDVDGTILTFNIITGDTNNYFAIDDTGVITLTTAGAANIDYETVQAYTLGVQAIDNDYNQSEIVDVTVNLTDVIEPEFSLSDGVVTVTEGDSGTTTIQYTVTLSQLPGADETVSVYYATADGTATAGVDYTAAFGTLTFIEGDAATKTFDVLVIGDADVEADETFTVTLSNATGSIDGAEVSILAAAATSTVTIIDDDVAASSYTLTADATSVTEGNPITFTVTALDAEGNPTAVAETTFDYQISGAASTGYTAATPADDLGNVTGTVTIAAGASTGTFTLTPTDDGVTEGFEGFNITLLDADFNAVAVSDNVVIKDGAEAGQTFVLTTAADTITGTSGNDTINGAVGTDGLAANGTTLGAGDVIDGGAGTDILNISVSGTDSAVDGSPIIISAVTLTNVEKVSVSNFETTTDNTEINMAQASGVETVTLANSSDTGDTDFTSVQNIVAAEMANGSGDLTIGYTSTVVAGTTLLGTANTQTLTVSNVTGGTFDSDGIETLSVTSNGSVANVLTNLLGDELETVNVDGAQAVTIGTAVGVAGTLTFNAADATGKITATLAGVGVMTVTGGSADDTITMTADTLASTDTIDLGDGTDTLVTDTAITVATQLGGITNVEVLSTNAAVTLAANIVPTTFKLTSTNTLTLNTGYTNATTATLTDAATVVNSANVALTVNADDDDFAGAGVITGGTGADAVNLTAKSEGGTAIAALTSEMSAVETITIVDGGDAASGATIAGDDINITTGAYATALTIDGSALDGGTVSALGVASANDEQLTVDGTLATKVLTITGGGGQDNITGGTANDVIDGGAGNDTLIGTAGGNDTISGGAGDDTITMGAALTANDTIDGGDGTDTLQVTTISAAALVGVTNVENLEVTGTTTVSLATDLAFTTIDISSAAVQSITFATGYTNATTVKLGANPGDTVVNSANIALTVDATDDGAITAATTITGGTGTDVINVTADGGTSTFTNVTLVETVTVRDGTTAGDDITLALGAYATALSIDASALDAGTLNAAGTAMNADDEVLTVTASGVGDLTITGGAGWDLITVGSGDDTLSGGGGNDTFTMAENLDNLDTIDGGDGTDILSVTGASDVNFINVSNVETLTLADNTAVTLSSYAQAAGITKVNLTAGNTTVDAGGVTSGINLVAVTANDTLTGGTGNDTFTFTGTDLDTSDQIIGGTGTDTISMSNTVNGGWSATVVVDDVAAGGKISGVENFTVLDADGGDTAGAENADPVSLTFNDTAATAAMNITVSGAVITDTNDIFTVDAHLVLDAGFYTTFDITGGAAADVLSGGNGLDTISGGGGADTIDGGVGADVLTGGAGADTFVYVDDDSAGTKVDTITDFAAGSDNLQITVSGDRNWDLTDKGDVASNADGYGLLSATGTGGEYFFNTTNAQFVMDTDGNGLIQSGDTIITLTDETGFSSADVNFIVSGTTAKTVETGAGDDTVTFAAAGNDVAITGAGDDTIIYTTDGHFTAADTVTAGEGADILQVAEATLDDVDLALTTGVETLKLTAAATANLGANAVTSGITTVVTSALATTVAFGVVDTITIDAELLADNLTLTLTDAAVATVSVTNLEGDIAATLDSAGSTLAIALDDITGDSNTIALGTSVAATTVTGGVAGDTVTITSGAAVAIDVSSTTNASEFVITGGAGVQTITGSANGDIITGAADNDVITLNAAVAVDKVVFSGGAATMVLTLAANGADTITGWGSTDIINVALLGDGTTDAATSAAITTAAAQDVLAGFDGSQVISTDGTAANLTTGGSAVVTDWTNMTQVAAYLSERFTHTTTTADLEQVFVINDTTTGQNKTYIINFDSLVTANTTIDANEICLVGTISNGGVDLVDANVVYA